jgi:hypothetical protein
MKEIQGKEIKGYSYADGTHWYWGDKEVAVINEKRREIEWCDRTFNFPQEVIDDIRNRIPIADGVWIIEARRTSQSTTQGTVSIFVNGKDMDMHFNDNKELVDGEWKSRTPNDELGKFVYACLWHKLDYLYHFSDRFKDIFKPGWRKEK